MLIHILLQFQYGKFWTSVCNFFSSKYLEIYYPYVHQDTQLDDFSMTLFDLITHIELGALIQVFFPLNGTHIH